MPLTKQLKETIMADLQRDRAYRAAYFAEVIESMHAGEFSVGKRMLRNYINATLGFAELSKAVGSPTKSLMRMLSENSNPHADKLFGILGHLQTVAAAAKWYEVGWASQDIAAQIAGLSRTEFLSALSRLQVSPMQESAEEALASARRLRS